ncbi:hypothetical protein [Paractinoplanes rishiriensis]|uniref:PknH-like extracellular domain-containing protein n=1 Tax=Paractinoplanes rishiriensis TaxID=1050105 RepID=A0A919MZZ2_9ACTN|nr:hypothetical protein [Actinoplanes rishiriensis]GIE94432.1 hypothetical protein Ari01nite_18970 [Actinoplanes rishiriensis]
MGAIIKKRWTAATAGALLAAGCGSGPVETGVTTAPMGSVPSVSAGPSVSGSSAAPSPTASVREIPASIPASAFLLAADVPGKAKGKPQRLGAGDHELPEFCGRDYEQRERVGLRATQSLAFTSKDSPPDSTPKAMIYQDVIVFRGDGAEAFLTDLAAAVRDCPGGEKKNSLTESIGAGDASLLVERSSPARDDTGEPVGDGSRHYFYWAAVRVGDAVAFVSNTGWESGSADRDDTVHLGRKAAARLDSWR